MKVLVTGVKGQLGFDVCRILSDRGIEYCGADIEEFDITDTKATEEFITKVHPDAIIHCSAYTAVDKAEDNEALCYSVNADGPRNIASVAKRIGAKMMYISTDYVFPGTGEQFYTPDDATGPLSVYGKTKLAGEIAVREALDEHFIVRISWVFGINGANFVRTMLRLSQTKTDLNVVCDQIGSPTYTYDLAHLLCDMIVTDKYGTYHATNEGVCSWAEFAAEIMRLAGKSTVIHPIPTSEYPTRASRPLNSRMSKDKLEESGFSRLPTWQDALARYLCELEDSSCQ
ncbi:MAG: dTDP-4-dehydrorhamnose reductase [Clostridia bacterium]|nr:dTDP-4-dehydrorhamnose reductase [Clostridia bacterium]